MTQKLYNIISVVAVLILCFFLFRKCEHEETTEKLNKASQDSLRTFRDKDGLQHAKISVLEGSVSDLKKLNSQQDSSLRKLQALVDRKTTGATIVNTKTTDKGSTKTTVTYSHHIIFKPNNEAIDSVHVISDFPNNEPCPTPTYSTTIDETWVKGTIIANADSITRNLKTFNEYDIIEKSEREKFWKEKTPIIEIINRNPNTETIGVKSFHLKNKKVRRGFIFVTGVIVGSAATIAGITAISGVLR